MFFVVSLYWFLFLQTFFYEEHQLASSKNTYLVTWVTQLAQKAKLELGMWKAMYLHAFMKQMTI